LNSTGLGGARRFEPEHGQSQKEAQAEDEQAQAPKALEIQSPQEAHVAEVKIDPPNPSAGFS
jgi:hypothetical protein